MGGSNSKKRALVGPVIRFKGGHAVAVGKLPVDFSVKVWKRLPQVRVELAHAGLVWSCSGLGCVIDKIICEELFEDFELPLALNFLGVRRTTDLAASEIDVVLTKAPFSLEK